MTEEHEDEYVPNQISLSARLFNLIVSSAFIIWGGYEVWQNDMIFAFGGKGNVSKVFHLRNEEAITMYIGLLLVSACLISEIIDHYDKRNNEHIYHKIATCTLWPGVVLCAIGVLMH